MRKEPLSGGQQQQQQHMFMNEFISLISDEALINPNEQTKKIDKQSSKNRKTLSIQTEQNANEQGESHQ